MRGAQEKLADSHKKTTNFRFSVSYRTRVTFVSSRRILITRAYRYLPEARRQYTHECTGSRNVNNVHNGSPCLLVFATKNPHSESRCSEAVSNFVHNCYHVPGRPSGLLARERVTIGHPANQITAPCLTITLKGCISPTPTRSWQVCD